MVAQDPQHFEVDGPLLSRFNLLLRGLSVLPSAPIWLNHAGRHRSAPKVVTRHLGEFDAPPNQMQGQRLLSVANLQGPKGQLGGALLAVITSGLQVERCVTVPRNALEPRSRFRLAWPSCHPAWWARMAAASGTCDRIRRMTRR